MTGETDGLLVDTDAADGEYTRGVGSGVGSVTGTARRSMEANREQLMPLERDVTLLRLQLRAEVKHERRPKLVEFGVKHDARDSAPPTGLETEEIRGNGALLSVRGSLLGLVLAVHSLIDRVPVT